ncbi:MAG: NADH-quinone oxidoreductase subunit H [Nitrospiraceae bacterium]|nr:NADH-quinone oxidoreductase subunit H [Nitrospiraceae bacterium]MDA8090197.1 NADH-quinone oxidoreductase subunit H [Nitrospiraceae bacterium]
MRNLQFLIILLLSPLVQGLIKKMKAYAQGRIGAGVLQPYRDLARLFKKDMVISETTSWIFHATPYIVFLSILAACIMTPVITPDALVFGIGDIIALLYTLALGRFFLVLAGLDAGTAFGGEGSSREATVAILVEPMMMLAIFTAAVAGNSTKLSAISKAGHILDSPAHVLAFAAFFVALIADTGRIPVDNPDTHLELTMIHEGMLLEYSGKYLALLEWAHYMKQMLLFTIAADLFFPYGISGGLLQSSFFYIIKMLALAAAMALAESSRAKLRFFQLPSLLGGAFVLSLLSIITFVMLGR